MPIKYSLVVPTYKESGNIRPLCQRVFQALEKDGFKSSEVEMIIVDDNSRDGSVEIVDELKKEGFNVRIDVRTTERGLSSAVIHGLKKSAGDFRLVMDADLQHPPEFVPALFKCLEEDNNQFVCGTRYGVGATIDKDWPLHRRIISSTARFMARPLTALSDPMSGFFAIRKECFELGLKDVDPIGYKIALELFVKCHVAKHGEVLFNFSTRKFGESKLTGKIFTDYLKHLHRLYSYKYGVVYYSVYFMCALLAFQGMRGVYNYFFLKNHAS
ncbi:unnamed protein product [Phytomonas sp. EM1]|nr:unnamed protein product [Phytomonas sp. EM1]|eukprot:CCW59915.1 unnamed protein product [Phytomonas sp. isolate EM1]